MIALVMAIAAGKSAEEKRWVKFSEMEGELCAIKDGFSEGEAADECLIDGEYVEDSGAINWGQLLGVGGPTPAKRFENSFAPFFVPPREAKRRPDLAEKKVQFKL